MLTAHSPSALGLLLALSTDYRGPYMVHLPLSYMFSFSTSILRGPVSIPLKSLISIIIST